MSTIPSFYDSGLQVDQTGVVTAAPGQPHLRPAQLQLRWSDDGGHNWSNPYNASLGLTGETTARALWRRLGKSRNRVYEVVCSDPVAVRLVNAFVNADPQFKPTERLVAQLAKMA